MKIRIQIYFRSNQLRKIYPQMLLLLAMRMDFVLEWLCLMGADSQNASEFMSVLRIGGKFVESKKQNMFRMETLTRFPWMNQF